MWQQGWEVAAGAAGAGGAAGSGARQGRHGLDSNDSLVGGVWRGVGGVAWGGGVQLSCVSGTGQCDHCVAMERARGGGRAGGCGQAAPGAPAARTSSSLTRWIMGDDPMNASVVKASICSPRLRFTARQGSPILNWNSSLPRVMSQMRTDWSADAVNRRSDSPGGGGARACLAG